MESAEHIPVVSAYVHQEGSWWAVGLVGVSGQPHYGPYRSEQEARDAIPEIAMRVCNDLTMIGHLHHQITYNLPTIKRCLEELGLAFWKTEGT